MSEYSELEVDLGNGKEFARVFGVYDDDTARYSFRTLGTGSSTERKPVEFRSYFLNPESERVFLERMGSYICLVDSGARLEKVRPQPSDHPVSTPDELKKQLGWNTFGSEPIDPTEPGLQLYLGGNAKRIPQLVMAHAFGADVTADSLRLSATTISPVGARLLFGALKQVVPLGL